MPDNDFGHADSDNKFSNGKQTELGLDSKKGLISEKHFSSTTCALFVTVQGVTSAPWPSLVGTMRQNSPHENICQAVL